MVPGDQADGPAVLVRVWDGTNNTRITSAPSLCTQMGLCHVFLQCPFPAFAGL